MRKIIMLSLVLVVLVLVGCSGGVTGSAASVDAVDGNSEYASGSDAPQKEVKKTGTGHEQSCY